MDSGQPLFELLDALSVSGAFAAEALGEGMDQSPCRRQLRTPAGEASGQPVAGRAGFRRVCAGQWGCRGSPG